MLGETSIPFAASVNNASLGNTERSIGNGSGFTSRARIKRWKKKNINKCIMKNE